MAYITIIQHCITSKEVWNTLERQLRSTGHSHRANALQSLVSFRLGDTEVELYCMIFMSKREDVLTSFDQVDRPTDYLFSLLFLNGLNSQRFETFVLHHKGTSNTLPNLEELMGQARDHDPMHQSKPSTSLFNSNSISNSHGRNTKNFTDCGKKNHDTQYCWSDITCD